MEIAEGYGNDHPTTQDYNPRTNGMTITVEVAGSDLPLGYVKVLGEAGEVYPELYVTITGPYSAFDFDESGRVKITQPEYVTKRRVQRI